MKYLIELKEFIENNIQTIPVPGYQLHQKFNISESKLEKDFKKHESITLRKYLIKLKINLAFKIKRENPAIKNIELMTDISYNYTEKSFRNHLKYCEEESIEYDDFSDFFLLNKNTQVFLEILIRFILINELAKVEIDNWRLIIKQNVKGSIFQLAQFIIPIEAKHIYLIDLQVDEMKLNYMMLAHRLIDVDEEGEDLVYTPNHIAPYFKMLYNIEKKVESQINYSLIDCVKDWDTYIDKENNMDIDFSEYPLSVKPSVDKMKLEVNDQASFIKETNYIIDDLKDKLNNQFVIGFENEFGFNLIKFKLYLKAVSENNFEMMTSFLLSNKSLDIKKIDLLIQITCHPYLNNIDIYDYFFYVEDLDLLKKITLINNTKLSNLFINLRKFYVNIKDSVDIEEDFEIEELLNKLL